MAIYTPNELAALGPATDLPTAIGKAAVKIICTSAPYLAGYGLATGNLPAFGAGVGADIACNLPIVPLNEIPPPLTTPINGGCNGGQYLVKVRRQSSLGDCSKGQISNQEYVLTGPVGVREFLIRMESVPCRPTPIEFKGVQLTQGGGLPDTGIGLIFPELGDWYSVDCTPLSGQDDSNCTSRPVNPILPPGYLLPPGYPDAPFLPPVSGREPIYRPENPTGPPYRWLPFFTLPVPLPIIVAPTVPISVPISIPINVPVQITPTLNVNASLTIQIDPDGNVRTPPDLICPCPDDSPTPPPTCPDTTSFQIPYYACSPEPGFQVATLEVVASSVPSGLADKLLSSSNLAEIGCESLSPVQEAPSLLYSGQSGSVLLSPYYSPVLPEEVVSVELRITEFNPEQHREITGFPGAGQRKFGAVSWSIADQEGGSDQIYIWDTKTYIRLPKRLKPLRLKVLLREAIKFEIWDTGERTK